MCSTENNSCTSVSLFVLALNSTMVAPQPENLIPMQVPENTVKDNMTFEKSAIENSWVISGNGSLNVLLQN